MTRRPNAERAVASLRMERPRLIVAARSAKVTVHAREVDAISTVGGTVTRSDAEVEVSSGSESIEITVPLGTDVVIGAASGRVRCFGQLGAVSITTASGSVEVEHGTDVDVRTMSGRVRIGSCTQSCRVNSRSSRVDVGSARTIDGGTVSGRIEVDHVEVANLTSVSGRLAIGTSHHPDITARTASGSVAVSLPVGVCPQLTLTSKSTKPVCDCDAGNDGRIDVSTTSGSIRVNCR